MAHQQMDQRSSFRKNENETFFLSQNDIVFFCSFTIEAFFLWGPKLKVSRNKMVSEKTKDFALQWHNESPQIHLHRQCSDKPKALLWLSASEDIKKNPTRKIEVEPLQKELEGRNAHRPPITRPLQLLLTHSFLLLSSLGEKRKRCYTSIFPTS